MLEERLPAAELPRQHDFSTGAYLQIAAEIPPNRIIVLTLEQFHRLVSAIISELYPVFAQYALSRNIIVERLFVILQFFVGDPLHILSQKALPF